MKKKRAAPFADPTYEKKINPFTRAHPIRGAVYLLLLLAVCAMPFALAQRTTVKGNRPANVITVINTNDSGPGSLRQALADANDGDTINFAVTGAIGLISGELLVGTSITISGPGAQNLAVIGNNQGSVFNITTYGRTVTISGLTISNNSGAAIHNEGEMDVTYSNVGAIWNDAAHTSCYATIELNYSSIAGIQSLTCQSFGCCQASVTVENSTVSGGGIYTEYGSALQISNSTISGSGGAVNSGSGCVISNSTLKADSGYDIRSTGFVVALSNTVLKIGPSGHSIIRLVGQVKSLGYSLSSDDGGGYLNGPGDQINTDPMLGPLQDNGGPTLTNALLPGSPAINAGDPNFQGSYDQRGPGYDRVRNGRLDIGSFEVQQGASPSAPTSPTPHA